MSENVNQMTWVSKKRDYTYGTEGVPGFYVVNE
jgi:hypothetical protein